MIDRSIVDEMDKGYCDLVDAIAIQAVKDARTYRKQWLRAGEKLAKAGVIRRILSSYNSRGGQDLKAEPFVPKELKKIASLSNTLARAREDEEEAEEWIKKCLYTFIGVDGEKIVNKLKRDTNGQDNGTEEDIT